MINLLEDRVAIQPVFDSDKIGNIYIPDQAKSRCKQGLVKYVGSNVRSVTPGDYVFFPGYSGTVFNLEGEGLLIIMREKSLVAVIKSNRWDSITIDGLYFRDRHNEYWAASYEQALHMITKAITHSGLLIELKDVGDKINETED
jgi:co-chaperonin GroES (HSP10)